MRLRSLLETKQLCRLRLRDSQKIYELLDISSMQADKMTSDLAPLQINTDYRRAIRPALTVRILLSVACRLIWQQACLPFCHREIEKGRESTFQKSTSQLWHGFCRYQWRADWGNDVLMYWLLLQLVHVGLKSNRLFPPVVLSPPSSVACSLM